MPNKFDHPTAVGIPEIAPVELSNVMPVGRAPVATLQVYGGVPPVADMIVAYAVPTVTFGRSAVVIVNVPAVETGADIVTLYDCEAVAPTQSITRMPKV